MYKMSDFHLPVKPRTKSKSIRFPITLIAEVEKAIQGKKSTFTAFVIASVRYSLDNLNQQQKREHHD